MFTISIHVMVAQHMITRSVKPLPDFQECLILRDRNTEISQLNYEIRAQLGHPVDKNFQPLIRVVDDIFMHIGHHAKAHETIFFLDRLRPGQGGELRNHKQRGAARRRAVSQEFSARDNSVIHRLNSVRVS